MNVTILENPRLVRRPTPEPIMPGVGSVDLAYSRGPCGGVAAAIQQAERFAEIKNNFFPDGDGPALKGVNELVHNSEVSHALGVLGIQFVKSIEELNTGDAAFFSAHGQSRGMFEEALRRVGETGFVASLECMLVRVPANTVEASRELGSPVIYISTDPDKPHEEVTAQQLNATELFGESVPTSFHNIKLPIELGVEGIKDLSDDELMSMLSQSGYDITGKKLTTIVGQTTLLSNEFLAFRHRIENLLSQLDPDIKIINTKKSDVCSAVSDRQGDLLIAEPSDYDGVLLAADPKSNNGRAMRDLVISRGFRNVRTFEKWQQIEDGMYVPGSKIIASAAASTPGTVLDEMIFRINPNHVGTIGRHRRRIDGGVFKLSENPNNLESRYIEHLRRHLK
jgi:4-hydroxy-3-methylbut-2-en-1-yl diphosphate reductase